MFWMKQMILVEFILIDVASLLYNVEVIGMDIVYIQLHQYMRVFWCSIITLELIELQLYEKVSLWDPELVKCHSSVCIAPNTL